MSGVLHCCVTIFIASKLLPYLLSVEQILNGALSALQALKGSPLQGGLRSPLEDTLMDTEITEEITQQFETTASQCITAATENIRGHFPQAHTLTLLGHLVSTECVLGYPTHHE